jgi:hypothetical protein
MFWKLDLFPSAGEGRETPTLFGPLERANSGQWTKSINPVIERIPVLVEIRHFT